MATSTSTSIQTQVSQKGDKVTVKTIETVTTKKPGQEPKVEKTEKEVVYDSFDKLPEELRKSLEENKKIDPTKINYKAASAKFQQKFVDEVNKIRKAQKVDAIKICDTLSKLAKETVEKLAADDSMGKGMSFTSKVYVLSYGSSDPEHKVKASKIVDDVVADHEEKGSLSSDHYKQLTSKDTKEFGVAAAKSKTNKIYVVVVYDPPYTNHAHSLSHKPDELPHTGRRHSISSGSGSESSDDDDSPRHDKYNRKAVKITNALRKKHGVPMLKYSPEIAKYAQEWADHLAAAGAFKHRNPNKYGENLYSCSGMPAKAKDACQQWYDEIRDYTFGKEPANLPGKPTGHFTQMVWKGTDAMGVGVAKGRKGWIVVANYCPPGNILGHFKENVSAPR